MTGEQAGHVFVLHGDITRLHCDAWALPTDPGGRVEPGWLAHAPESLRTDRARRVPGPPVDGAAALPEWPGCVLVDVGRSGAQAPAWYGERATAFLEVARTQPRRTTRERPLFALPMMGTAQAGGAAVRGAIIRALLEAVEQAAADGAFDVVLVAYRRDALAACQQIRRTRPGRWDAIGDLVADADRLAERARRGGLVLFVGAGVSAGAGLPDWEGLLKKLTAELRFDDEQAAALPTLDALDRARIIADELQLADRSIGEAVRDRFAPYQSYGLVHGQLACLPVTELVTTNYDHLLQSAADAAGDPLTVLPYERLHRNARWLLMLHGSVEHPEDIVLTREDYLDYAARRGALQGLVQALLITRHMLFVGFSLRDDNFLRIAHEVRQAVARAPGRETFGTLLSLQRDPARERLWQGDLDTVSFGPPHVAAEGENQRMLAVAARRVEIFLDRLLLWSSAETSHILDPTMAGALAPEEESARAALLELAAATERAPAGSPAWDRIRSLLRDFGA